MDSARPESPGFLRDGCREAARRHAGQACRELSLTFCGMAQGNKGSSSRGYPGWGEPVDFSWLRIGHGKVFKPAMWGGQNSDCYLMAEL